METDKIYKCDDWNLADKFSRHLQIFVKLYQMLEVWITFYTISHFCKKKVYKLKMLPIL